MATVWLNVTFTSIYSMVVATFMSCPLALRASGIHRGQVWLLLSGLLLPWIVNCFTRPGLSPIPQLDLTSMIFSMEWSSDGPGPAAFSRLLIWSRWRMTW